MDETKKGDIIEAFGIHGNNAPTVDKHIFGIVLRSVGMNPTNDEIADMFQKGSKGGMIDATTCVAMAIGFLAKSKDNDKELREAFAVFDKEKEGKISAAELRQVISNLGEKVDEDEIEDMMKEADRDGSGTIDYAEFVNVLMRPVKIPPRVDIPEHLKPFMTDAKKKKEDNSVSA
ncbi:calmodulin [Chrysochromulina tobinii]|uniref:Calmodulin n=1 Tax=Chrysochromulina tobinii TaxID=1460289 RepID=A0A0M0J4Y5_9EUKA|nr:calmodulin [Chrysochromulina tobinii]|eukprot:KOO21679.1 calmodulin [Chrysochromulina sp. CCMP291]